MASAALNAASNPDGSGVPTVGLTHSPAIDVASGGVAAALGLARVVTPVSANVLDLIIADHNRLRAFYDTYIKLSPALSLEHRQLLAWELVMIMSEHAAKEELVLYPCLRAVFGDAEADKCLSEHAQVKLLAAKLDTMIATDPGFDSALRAAVESMLAHVAEEEGVLLPRLGAALTPTSLLQLGLQFEAAKVRAPTRPHPEAPNLAPFNEAALAAAKQVDTALDQARMPSVVPAVVAILPGMEGLTVGAAPVGPPIAGGTAPLGEPTTTPAGTVGAAGAPTAPPAAAGAAGAGAGAGASLFEPAAGMPSGVGGLPEAGGGGDVMGPMPPIDSPMPPPDSPMPPTGSPMAPAVPEITPDEPMPGAAFGAAGFDSPMPPTGLPPVPGPTDSPMPPAGGSPLPAGPMPMQGGTGPGAEAAPGGMMGGAMAAGMGQGGEPGGRPMEGAGVGMPGAKPAAAPKDIAPGGVEEVM